MPTHSANDFCCIFILQNKNILIEKNQRNLSVNSFTFWSEICSWFDFLESTLLVLGKELAFETLFNL